MSRTTIKATPEGRQQKSTSKRGGSALGLQDAIDAAKPGDVIELAPGIYDQPVIVKGKHGGKKRITIRGAGHATLDGRRNAVRPRGTYEINDTDYAFIRIVESSGIALENLTIQNVWPTAIYIGESQDIEVRKLNLNGATFGIFAKGQTTRRILVEHCAWLQDPSIWDRVAWTEIHDRPHPRRELDGDFFRSFDIKGDVVIRHNYISHAFNGVHFFAGKEQPESAALNDNVWIYENTFAFIRDNAVEAEHMATNWFVFANRVLNCHVWLAFEDCTGGFWYVFGNRGWFTRKPGPPGDCNTGGGVIKASNNKRLQEGPFYFFNNSFYVRGPYIKKGKLANLEHFNNALEFARARYHAEGLVEDGRNPFGGGGPDPRCDGSDDPPTPFTRDWTRLKTSFHDDVWDHPLYPVEIRALGWPVSGKGASPRFASGRSGDFSTPAESPCVGTGASPELRTAGAGPWRLPAAMNIGALADSVGEPYRAQLLACPAKPPFA